MRGETERLIVVRARFSLDVMETRIEEIIASFPSLSNGNLRIELYRQVGLPRDIQWLIYPGEPAFSDGIRYSDRLQSALGEYCTVDRTDWQIISS